MRARRKRGERHLGVIARGQEVDGMEQGRAWLRRRLEDNIMRGHVKFGAEEMRLGLLTNALLASEPGPDRDAIGAQIRGVLDEINQRDLKNIERMLKGTYV